MKKIIVLLPLLVTFGFAGNVAAESTTRIIYGSDHRYADHGVRYYSVADSNRHSWRHPSYRSKHYRHDNRRHYRNNRHWRDRDRYYGRSGDYFSFNYFWSDRPRYDRYRDYGRQYWQHRHDSRCRH